MTSSERLTLRLYVREQCSLCEEMYVELLPWRSRLGFDLETLDIDSDPQLKALYDYKVPVLVEGDYEICHHFVDEDVLLDHFRHR